MTVFRRPRFGLWLMVGALTLAGSILLWPLPGSERWDIPLDEAALAGKARYLQALAPAGPDAPNVLLIVADDLGRYDVGFHGESLVPTPNLDALAASGKVFGSAYATAAICAPSRAALLTGRIQNRFGFESQPMQRYVRNLGEFLGFRYLIDTDAMQPFLLGTYPDAAQMAAQGLPASEITLAEVFRQLDYRTAILGKWHLGYGSENHPTRFGFDQQYGFMEAFSLYASKTRSDIRAYHHDLFWETHIWDMGRTGPSAITRNGRVIDEPRYLTDAIAEETIAFMDSALDEGRRFFAYVPFNAPHTPFQARQDDYDALIGIDDPNARVYGAMIRRLDHAVGRLVAHLEDRRVLERTLIVFTSDNGGADYTGATDNGPLRGGKFTQFEGGLAVPLVIRAPGPHAPGVVRSPVLLSDIFATLVTAAGAPLPSDRVLDSRNLLDGGDDGRTLFWRSDFNTAMRQGPWKLLQNRRDRTVRLYNLADDPGETRDLSRDAPGQVAGMLDALARWEAGLATASWPRVMNYRYRDEGGSYWFAI